MCACIHRGECTIGLVSVLDRTMFNKNCMNRHILVVIRSKNGKEFAGSDARKTVHMRMGLMGLLLLIGTLYITFKYHAVLPRKLSSNYSSTNKLAYDDR